MLAQHNTSVMNTPNTMQVRILRPTKLSPAQIDQMCDLYMANHHIDRTPCQQRITSGFDRIALFLCKETGRVVGFNGMRIKKHRIEGFVRPVRSLYLGQMYVEPSFRGKHPIHKVCTAALWPVLLFQPWYRNIIWGDALTYKPFLLIAHTANKYFPNPEKRTPGRYRDLFDHLGETHYGEKYDAATGCVIKDKKLLKEHVVPLDQRLLRNPLIRFYAEKNIHYRQGHGLLVMMDYTWSEVFAILRKITKPARRRFLEQLQLSPIPGPTLKS